MAALQAVALYLLSEAATKPFFWPATEPHLFGPLILVAAFIPLVILQGLSKLDRRPLAVWALAAMAVVAFLGWWGADRGRFVDEYMADGAFWPDGALWFIIIIGLFIAHTLVVDSVTERRFFPSYPLHFDTAWTQGVQVVLTAAFVSVFWLVLELGGGLFKLLNIDAFQRAIGERWFAIPATTLTIAVGIHLTDVQAALTRGARSLGLTLLSWLAPLLVLILLAFLISLPFVSLETLWDTKFAAQLLLVAAGALVVFINTCYQDGGERPIARAKRLAASLGAVELVPLVGLAAWALGLRVAQYGWTAERITAAAVTLAAACYATGYLVALVRSPRWLQRLEIVNFATAYVILALILALFSPVADPARLMVADQVSRLNSGRIKPGDFDYAALRIEGARWGKAALAALTAGRAGPPSLDAAKQALAAKNRWQATPAPAPDLSRRVAVYPPGRTLPPRLYDALGVYASADQPLSVYWIQQCAQGDTRCAARILRLRPGDSESVLLTDFSRYGLLQQDVQGRWRIVAEGETGNRCDAIKDDIQSGKLALAPHPWPDLVIGAHRLALRAPDSDCVGAGDAQVSKVAPTKPK